MPLARPLFVPGRHLEPGHHSLTGTRLQSTTMSAYETISVSSVRTSLIALCRGISHQYQGMESEQPWRLAPVSRTLTVIGAVVIAEPLSATLLLPFVYFMIRNFNTVEERYVGFWAGLISMIQECLDLILALSSDILIQASAFFIPQMLTATLWGVASDKLGRKPVMLLGLVGSAACMLLFGFSKSLAWAIASRGLCGLFNGTTSR